jgi:hypothetical protein
MSLATESTRKVGETEVAVNPQVSFCEQQTIGSRISSRPSPVYGLNTNKSSSSNSNSKAGAANSNFSYSTLSSYSPLPDKSIPSRPVIVSL